MPKWGPDAKKPSDQKQVPVIVQVVDLAIGADLIVKQPATILGQDRSYNCVESQFLSSRVRSKDNDRTRLVEIAYHEVGAGQPSWTPYIQCRANLEGDLSG